MSTTPPGGELPPPSVPAPQEPAYTAGAAPSSNNAGSDNGNGKNKALLWSLIGVGIALVIAVIIIAVVLLTDRNNDPAPTPVPAETSEPATPEPSEEPSAQPTEEPSGEEPLVSTNDFLVGFGFDEDYPAADFNAPPFWVVPEATGSWTYVEGETYVGFDNSDSQCQVRYYREETGLTNNDYDDTLTFESQNWDEIGIDEGSLVEHEQNYQVSFDGLTGLEFLYSSGQYTDTDDVVYQIDMLSRNFSQIGYGYHMVYVCPVDQYSTDGFQNVADVVKLDAEM